jgi:trehalose 6-phosphate synthase
MRRLPFSLAFSSSLVIGLGLLAWIASIFLDRLTRTWLERDLAERASLMVNLASRSLVPAWRAGERASLESALVDLALAEQVRGVVLCDPSGSRIAATPELPDSVSCESAVPRMSAADGDRTALDPVHFRATPSLLVSAIQVNDFGTPLGFAVVAQDLEGRGASEAQRFILIAFGVLAIAASVYTTLTLRYARRGWHRELRDLLRGAVKRREFSPLLDDVRALAERMAATYTSDGTAGTWSAGRLRTTMEANLLGEQVIIVANRAPYLHDKDASGKIRVVHPASGLVTALEPVMRATSGTWIAHGSGKADRETADRHGRLRVPPGEEAYTLRRLWLTTAEERGYYYGFANEGLWPLCHIAHAGPVFRASDWTHYRNVNKKFANAVVEEATTDDPVVLVQDYHFALAPKMIRERLPRATIISFWHIPWPNAERFGICPWRDEILEGLLGSNIMGFHTAFHCHNFFECVDRYLEARLDRERQAVVLGGRTTLIRPYPISVEWPSAWAASSPSVEECRKEIRQELGLKPDALIGVGVDRLDYTKGIPERFAAVERLLERHPEFRGKFTFVELAAPSRTLIGEYRQLNERLEEQAARINRRYSTSDGYKPIVFLRAHHEPQTIYRYYRAADLCYVSSLHDGMNLVSKEFISSRDDEKGVLMLSRFTGAASELTEALLVNPYDIEEASAALAAALTMPVEEQQSRMRPMRGWVAEYNVYWWAGQMLIDAARLRRRQQLAENLTGRPEAATTSV